MIEISSSKNLSKLKINDYNRDSGEKMRHTISFKKFLEELNFLEKKITILMLGAK